MKTSPLPFSAFLAFTKASSFGMLLLVCLSGYGFGDDLVTHEPYKIKAAFLRNFAHYVTWPSDAFPDDDSVWRIGILGDDPFGDTLEKTLAGRMEQGRRFQVFRSDSLDELSQCQILFIAYDSPEKRQEALAALKDLPVLTVGDAPDFLEEGGIVRFQVGTYVDMSINLDQARAVSLKVQTPMLEVSREVLEDGILHRLR